MRFPRILTTGATIVALASGMVFAASHSSPDAIAAHKARVAHMELNGFNLGLLGKMAKGDIPFDADAAQRAANNLAALSSMIDTTSYWVEGSDSAGVDGSRLLPAAFENFADFEVKEQALVTAAAAMAGGAGTLEGVQANIGAVGGACGACHKAYRAPKN